MRLKEIREAKGMTQRQAALGLNLSPTVYNRYENGLREPSNAMLTIIAEYFGVTVDDLLGVKRENNSPAPFTVEARILANGVDQMPKEQRERALEAMRLIFTEYAPYFKKEGENDTDQ